MIIKNKKSLNEYKYIVVFDLASRVTGVCLWDVSKHIPISTDIIKINNACESKVKQLYIEIQSYFNHLKAQGIDLKDILVCKEAMPTQLHSGSSTIQTFIALAKSHAILDLCLINNNIDFYDEVGIYPASTYAHFRKIHNLTAKDKVDKNRIHEYVCEKYFLENIILDESDAVFLAETFVDSKWNNDLNESIREIKRHKKTLKAPHAIKECDEQINKLMLLKN